MSLLVEEEIIPAALDKLNVQQKKIIFLQNVVEC